MRAIASESIGLRRPQLALAAGRWRGPRWTLRLRLTLLYGALFLVTGAVLLGITYGLVARTVSAGDHTYIVQRTQPVSPRSGVTTPRRTAIVIGSPRVLPPPTDAPKALRGFATQLQKQAASQLANQRQSQLHALLTRSGLALGIMAFISIGLGWLMAGRTLRPIRTMAIRARGITERNLHERLAVDGPSDELKELGDTFDELLGRLERAFESQRRFVANASHELRTPITVGRTLTEVALADPDADEKTLRAACERVLANGEQQERLIEALLTLARSERGFERCEPFDLARIARHAVATVERGDVSIDATGLDPAWVNGDRALAERLVANLIANAVRYNVPGGWVGVHSETCDGSARLRVCNSGPAIAPADLPALLEPFRRGDGERARDRHGHGLGLSIVAAIVRAHNASLNLTPGEGGGLTVEVAFPRM
ncbi:MAG: sensor histidine kinase [Gaiellaceae bacterium]